MVIIALAAVLISLGITYTQFGILPSDSSSANNAVQSWLSSVRANGWTLIWIGVACVIGSMIYFMILTLMDKPKFKVNKSGKRILFDEMYDGKDIELAKSGYDTHSIKKLRLTGEPLHYDYSVIKYAEENKMILITEDPEIHGGCQENNLPSIKLGQNPSIEEIIKALESLKAN